MYLLLLVFGGVLAAAGIVLAGSGLSLHDHTFDATIVTPGVVAAVGGLLLMGLGLALRALQRIERAIALRSGPRATAPEELPEPSLMAAAGEIARIPSAAKAPRPPGASVGATPPLPAGKREDLTDKMPVFARLETARIVEETELSLSPEATPPAPMSAEQAATEVDQGPAVKRRNGAAPPRLAPRFENSPRPPTAPERAKGPAFDSLWPKGPRRPMQPGAERPVVAPAAEREHSNRPAVDESQAAAPVAAPETVSVLKSGVVDGMAYTLYSDGSIEAQLPQGTLRFGSITELRNHIEQSA